MRILRHRRRRRMYCGSCLRDNALAARAAWRAGHDVVLLPVYTPTRTDEDNVSRLARLLRRHQRLPEQHVAALPQDAGDARLHLGRAGRDPARDRPRRLGRSRAAGRPDGLDAARRAGPPAQGVRASCSRYLKQQAALRRGRSADVAARSLAPPLRRELRRPGRLHAPGRGPVPRGSAGSPTRSRRRRSSRAARRTSTRFIATSDYYARLHGAATSAAAARRSRSCRSGSTSTGFEPAPRRRARSALHDRLLRAHRPREGPAPAGRGLHPPAARAGARRSARLEAAGYLAPEHRTYLDGVTRRSPPWASRRVPLPRGDRPAAQARVPPGHRRALGPEPLRRAEGPLPARGDGQRRAGRRAAARRVPRDLEKTGGGAARRAGRRAAPGRRGCSSSGRIPRGGASSAGAAARACGATTRPRAWPSARSRSAPRRGRVREPPDAEAPLGVSKAYPTRRAGRCRSSRTCRSRSRAGESLCVIGPSGSGKSTLLYILGALEPPTRGHGAARRPDPTRCRERALAAFRNREVGFVFQDHFLLPQCTVLENVLAPTLVAAARRRTTRRARATLLEQVGLGDRLDHRPAELSGGERQRVGARARAVMRAARAALRRAHRQPRRRLGAHAWPPCCSSCTARSRRAGAGDAQRRAGGAAPQRRRMARAAARARLMRLRTLVLRSLAHYRAHERRGRARASPSRSRCWRARCWSATRCARACARSPWRASADRRGGRRHTPLRGVPRRAARVAGPRHGRRVLSLRGVVIEPGSGRRASPVEVWGVDERFWAFHGLAAPALGARDALAEPGARGGARRRRGRDAARARRGGAGRFPAARCSAAATIPGARCGCGVARRAAGRGARRVLAAAAAGRGARAVRAARHAPGRLRPGRPRQPGARPRRRRRARSRAASRARRDARGPRAAPARGRARPARGRSRATTRSSTTPSSTAAREAARPTPGSSPRVSLIYLANALRVRRRMRCPTRSWPRSTSRVAGDRLRRASCGEAAASAGARRRSCSTTGRPASSARGSATTLVARRTTSGTRRAGWRRDSAEFRVAGIVPIAAPPPTASSCPIPGHHEASPPRRLGPAVPGRPLARPAAGRGLLAAVPHDAEGVRAARRGAGALGTPAGPHDVAPARARRAASAAAGRSRGVRSRARRAARPRARAASPSTDVRAPRARGRARRDRLRRVLRLLQLLPGRGRAAAGGPLLPPRRSSSGLRELGLLRAVGFTEARLRRRVPRRGRRCSRSRRARSGMAGAVGYAWLMMLGLRTVWVGAVGTRALALAVGGAELATGALARDRRGAPCGRAHAARPARALGARLLARAPQEWAPVAAAGARAWAVVLGAAGRRSCSARRLVGRVGATAAFFGAGALLLAACLLLVAARLAGERRRAEAGAMASVRGARLPAAPPSAPAAACSPWRSSPSPRS